MAAVDCATGQSIWSDMGLIATWLSFLLLAPGEGSGTESGNQGRVSIEITQLHIVVLAENYHIAS